MKTLQIKSPYQDLVPYFGMRNGKLYSGPFALDGTPVNQAGCIWQGLGASTLKNISNHALDVNNQRVFVGVEGAVRHRNMRPQSAVPTYSPLHVKGFEDEGPVKMRSGSIPCNAQGIAEFVPLSQASAAEIPVGTTTSPQQRFGAFLNVQDSGIWGTVANYGSGRVSVKAGQATFIIGSMDVLPIEGLSRLLTYSIFGSGFATQFALGGRLQTCDMDPTTGAFAAGVPAFTKNMCWSAGNAGHCTYAVPLDKSLVERDSNGAAIAYHMFYPTLTNGGATPGELRYKRVQLRPTVVEPADADSISIENITSTGWISANGGQGYLGVHIETRPFVYEHDGVRYLTIVMKRGVNKPASADYPFTIKRAVLTNGMPGTFETFNFPTLFAEYGDALVLSPDRKQLWHYAHNAPKIACFTMGASITLDQADLVGNQYISAIGVENGLCMAMTDQFEKYVLTPNAQPSPGFTLSFDKEVYALGETAQLTVTTTGASVLADVVVLGASVKEHTVEVTNAQPAVINLTVTGRLQATVADWL